MKGLLIKLDPAEHFKLKEYCLYHGITISDCIRELIRELIHKEREHE